MLVLTALYINIYIYIHTLVTETPCMPYIHAHLHVMRHYWCKIEPGHLHSLIHKTSKCYLGVPAFLYDVTLSFMYAMAIIPL